jgi:hypothetical protein
MMHTGALFHALWASGLLRVHICNEQKTVGSN